MAAGEIEKIMEEQRNVTKEQKSLIHKEEDYNTMISKINLSLKILSPAYEYYSTINALFLVIYIFINAPLHI